MKIELAVNKCHFDTSTSSVQVRENITNYSMITDFKGLSSVPTFYVGMYRENIRF
ncbi:MAG: hypothetical protein K8F36_03330 [Melioribacteraceae bacterium]|nr:hypothetical protein [Melioribacteraceae bacterium]